MDVEPSEGMTIELSTEESKTLRMALDRAIRAFENELVHTEAPALQHELAHDFERLVALRDRVFGSS